MFRGNLTKRPKRTHIASMQIHDRISAIDRRAAGMNLKLARVCRLAGVDYSLVWKWRRGRVRPLVETFERVTGDLERQLDVLEQETRDRLNRQAS